MAREVRDNFAVVAVSEDVIGDVFGDDRASANDRPSSDFDTRDDGGSCSDPGAFTDGDVAT
jgi:hypothetical protein